MDYRPLFTQFSDLLGRAKKSGVITKDHLETTNRTALNETHSLVLTHLLEAALLTENLDIHVSPKSSRSGGVVVKLPVLFFREIRIRRSRNPCLLHDN